jgi:hypothetical protein
MTDGGQYGSIPAAGQGDHWPTAVASLTVGLAFFSLLFDPLCPLHRRCTAWMLSGLDVVGNDLVAVGKCFVANSAFPALLDNLPVEHLAHLGWAT